VNHAETVLSGIILGEGENERGVRTSLEFSMVRLRDRHFADGKHKAIFAAILEYFSRTGGLLEEEVFLDMMVSSEVAEQKRQEYILMFRSLSQNPVSMEKVRYSIDELCGETENRCFVDALTKTMEVLDGKSSEKGEEGLSKYGRARRFLQAELMSIDELAYEYMPEVDPTKETVELSREYDMHKNQPERFVGCKTGFLVVDDLTNGGQGGELWLVAGYAGEGKSFTLMNSFYNAVYMQGMNCVIASTEMPPNQCRRRLIARHSRHPKFGLQDGLAYKDIKLGTLSPDEERTYKDVILKDLAECKDYGNQRIFLVPHDAGVDYIRMKVQQYNSLFPVHAIYIDYLSMLQTSRRRQSRREELDEIIKQCKQLALTFDGGRGCFVMSAFQTNRVSWEKAKRSGHYELNSFADSSEAEKSSDFAMWILRDPRLEEEHEMKAGIMKYRDDEKIREFRLYEDFATSFLGNLGSV